MTQELRSYDYVNAPFAQVREILLEEPRRLLQRATTVASTRAQALRVQLQAATDLPDLIELTAAAEIVVTSVGEARSPLEGPATRISFEWRAARAPAAFPVSHAVLWAYALTPIETQLELEATCAPPAGIVGQPIHAVIGRRIAEASMHRFLHDVAARLREELPRLAVRAG